METDEALEEVKGRNGERNGKQGEGMRRQEEGACE